ncbi:hypothetical protein [Streptomyces afghaniensis]|uniref:hypothetical protein n=1 Tax=Streptomyces afghaniensis TaxID=66865 RepID=UPI0037A85858
MITAVVGVLGTRFAPVLSQRISARQRTEETRAAEQRRQFEERRTVYPAMNRPHASSTRSFGVGE